MVELDETRAVVEEDETYDGTIMPTAQAEIDRAVRIYEDGTVEGGVYGATVELHDCTVEESVMAADAVEFDGGTVDGEVGTPGKVTGSDGTVHGTVTGKRVTLEGAVVYGNVVGADVILENCLVMGIVTAERGLTLRDSLCYTFTSHGETTLDGASIVLPQAVVEDVAFESPVTVTGLGQIETAAEGLPRMDADDVVEVDGETYLSLSPRILNLEAVSDRLDELEDALDTVVTASGRDERAAPEELLAVLGVDEAAYPGVV